jgi:formamidopyrimidine-DNA glycosylase
MIELPEAVVIAQQMAQELTGKHIAEGVRGNSPHKFAFYSGEPDYYAATLADKVVGPASARGGIILVPVEPGYVLGLGGGGERILYHRDATTLPKRHQLLLRFDDGSYLTVTVSGWGSAWLSTPEGLATHVHMGKVGVSPLSAAFTEVRRADTGRPARHQVFHGQRARRVWRGQWLLAGYPLACQCPSAPPRGAGDGRRAEDALPRHVRYSARNGGAGRARFRVRPI